ncbi:Zinc transporter ZIP14 [Hypsibius exemplaris]|uniref:Zinc transporter ZIP14 n=1 Tax=Hypsibius exemplaris TaxID=2072580 RepID=A0A1W0XBT1_HYPEX|nr:Zinc transporter ZIP14 [Hypsibius exemplaris]
MVYRRPPPVETWGYGLLFICLVCSCAAFGVCLYPLMKRNFFTYVITWMIGLAVGSLSGIALFQLIPQAFELGDTTAEEIGRYIHKSLVIILAFYVFFLAERLLKLGLQRRDSKRKLRSSPSEITTQENLECGPVPPSGMATDVPPDDASQLPRKEQDEVEFAQENPSLAPIKSENSEALPSGGHIHGLPGQPMQTKAWLILAGDSIVDGLSIGAAFSFSTLQGISIAVACLCEELPHELGDLAILLHSGLSLKRAILYNTCSGLPCFAGFIAGVFLGELAGASSWIFAVTSGMFFYISFINILPEMPANIEAAGKVSFKQGCLMLAVQTFGLLVGIVLMYILARFTGEIQLDS